MFGMIIDNISSFMYSKLVIIILSNTAMKALRDYERQLKAGKNPVFQSADIGMKEELDCWK